MLAVQNRSFFWVFIVLLLNVDHRWIVQGGQVLAMLQENRRRIGRRRQLLYLKWMAVLMSLDFQVELPRLVRCFPSVVNFDEVILLQMVFG